MSVIVKDDDIRKYQPRSGRLVREDGSYINEADIALQGADSFNVFNERRIVKRSPVVNLTSSYPISIFRDFLERGTTTHDVDRYLVNPNSTFESAELGRYVAGYSAETGVGILFDEQVITDCNWGYFDDFDGLFVRWDGTNYSLQIRRDGSDSPIPRSQWNVDKLDGTGPSGITFNPNDGWVIQIEFTWYGFGPIIFSIVNKFYDGVSPVRKYPIHVATVSQNTTIRNPNLPIRVENNSATGNVAVTGRQFSIVGEFNAPERPTYFLSPNEVTVDNNWTLVMSYQRDPTFRNISIAADRAGVINTGTATVEYQLLLGTTLSGVPDFQLPENRTSDECSVLFDTAATGFSGGEQFLGGFAIGQEVGRSRPSFGEREVDIRIPRSLIVSLVARTVEPSTSSDVRGFSNVIEEY